MPGCFCQIPPRTTASPGLPASRGGSWKGPFGMSAPQVCDFEDPGQIHMISHGYGSSKWGFGSPTMCFVVDLLVPFTTIPTKGYPTKTQPQGPLVMSILKEYPKRAFSVDAFGTSPFPEPVYEVNHDLCSLKTLADLVQGIILHMEHPPVLHFVWGVPVAARHYTNLISHGFQNQTLISTTSLQVGH